MSHAETVAQRIARFGAELRFEHLPSEVVASVRLRIADTLGVSIAAATTASLEPVWRLVIDGGGTPEATALVGERRLPAQAVGFINGLLSHALDFDDTHLPSILHPSAVIVPTGLAAAELAGASGSEAITAMAAGYELLVRLGMAAYNSEVKNSVYFEKGLHATSICGAVAAAAVASRLLDGSATHLTHSMGIAASMGAGLLEANRTGGTVKRIHGAWACHAGIWAARLASAGISGPPTVFEGRFGFYYYLIGDASANVDPAAGLGDEWETPGVFFKPYPVNHFIHTAIDAAIDIRRRAPLPPERIARVEVGVAGATLRTIAEPRATKVRPASGYTARFSAPFAVATALLLDGGGLGLDIEDFSETSVDDVRRLALAERVHCYADPECETIYPYEFPCRMRVCYDDGSSLNAWIPTNRGGPARPLTEEEVFRKFNDNVTRAYPSADLAAIRDALSRFDRLDRAARVFEPLGRTRAVALQPNARKNRERA